MGDWESKQLILSDVLSGLCSFQVAHGKCARQILQICEQFVDRTDVRLAGLIALTTTRTWKTNTINIAWPPQHPSATIFSSQEARLKTRLLAKDDHCKICG